MWDPDKPYQEETKNECKKWLVSLIINDQLDELKTYFQKFCHLISTEVWFGNNLDPVVDIAITHNKLHIAKWYYETFRERGIVSYLRSQNSFLFHVCCGRGFTEMVEWLWEWVGVAPDDFKTVRAQQAIEKMKERGHRHLLKYYGIECDEGRIIVVHIRYTTSLKLFNGCKEQRCEVTVGQNWHAEIEKCLEHTTLADFKIQKWTENGPGIIDMSEVRINDSEKHFIVTKTKHRPIPK